MKHSGIRYEYFDDDFNLINDTYKSVSFKDFFGDKIFNLNGGMDFLNESLRLINHLKIFILRKVFGIKKILFTN